MRTLAFWTLVSLLTWPSAEQALALQDPSRSESTSTAKQNLLVNGDFEQGLAGWNPFWSRQPSAGSVEIEKTTARQGKNSVRIRHRGTDDWSLAAAEPLRVRPGELYVFSGWVQLAGKGNCEISVILRDAAGQVIDWTYAGRQARATDGWRMLKARFMIPPGATTMLPRVIGYGPATVQVDDLVLSRERHPVDARATGLPAKLNASNVSLSVSFATERGTLSVLDRRTGQTWTQKPAGPALLVRTASAKERAIEANLVNPPTALEFKAKITLDADRPEIAIELTGSGELGQALAFPYPFESAKGSYLVMPVNEGMSYPVDDPSLPPMQYILYGGHGLCMGWWGVTDGRRGMMAIVDTDDDASVRVPRLDGRLCLCPLWDPQKGMFGPPRRIRYVFLDDGGHVAMAKRYRRHAQEVGLFKTLKEKQSENPSVDRLVGAVNVWCWDRDAVGIVKELQQAGIDRILWSNAASAEQIKAMNALGVLTSRYDIYQDVMNPATFSKLRYTHPDWPTKAWPADLMIGADGDWLKGWEIEGRDGGMYPCGVTCDRQAIPYAVERIGKELESKPYLCRFIDTTTASPWRECYDPRHPVTRTESRHGKMELLRLVSERFKLVTGSETGHEAAVPFVHYFEGMLSLGPYRVDDAGRNMQRIVQQVPPQIEKFQTGAFYRLPLWELVYHDCVVAQWYWGDYNNKLPAVWDRRDLYNALYGTPPMFMFTRRMWEKDRSRFVKSYKTVCPIARSTGYSEMLSHRWLTADHGVQQTVFANGQTVTVNLGKHEFVMPDGSRLAPLGLSVHPHSDSFGYK
jgi:Glycosyl hydrolases related to GH101 family, GH129/Carbohydrate binding domain